MKYRDAKQLHNGDQVIRKSDGTAMVVSSIEVYGQYKKVKINCLIDNSYFTYFNDEVQ